MTQSETLATKASETKKAPSRRPSRGFNVAQRGDRFLARVTDPHTRRRVAQTFVTKSDAEVWARTTLAKFQLRQATAAQTPFHALCESYMAALRGRSRSALHIDTVAAFLKVARDGGITDLNADNVPHLTRKILDGLKARGNKPASAKTKNNLVSRLRGVANWAIQEGKLTFNPFVRLRYLPVITDLKEVFDLDELGKLVWEKNADHPFYRAFCALIYTGFRQREVRFMDWSWILWNDERIAMRLDRKATTTLTAEEGKKLLIPKNGRARMTLLASELADVLRPHAQVLGPVFPDYRDLDTTGFQRRFDEYVKHCGVTIGARTPHSCRHTWTCVMLAGGENLLSVQRWAGHSHSDMTGHYSEQQDRFRTRIVKAGWKPGQMTLRDFSPGGRCYMNPTASAPLAMHG